MKDEEKVVPAEGQAADEKGQAAPDGNEAALGAASQEEGADEEKTKQPRKGTAGRLALRFIGVLVGLAYWTLIWCQLVVFVASGRSHWFEVGILLTVVAAVALAVADRRYRKRGEEEQRRWRLALLTGSVLILLAFLTYLAIDRPPVESDFTWSDLPVPATQAQESWEALLTYRHSGGGKKLTTREVSVFGKGVDRVLELEEDIEKMWEGFAEYRDYIETLDTFEGIADLGTSMFSPIVSFRVVRTIARGYSDFALLRAAQGRALEGAREIARLHSVTRKTLPYHRALIGEMVWLAVAGLNVNTAHYIVTRPDCSREALRVLKDALPPLTREDVSLRNPIIGEYLAQRQIIETMDVIPLSSYDVGQRGKGWRKVLAGMIDQAVSSRFFLNRNHTIAELASIYSQFARAERAMSPAAIKQVVRDKKGVRASAGLKNLSGRFLIDIGTPSLVVGAQNAWRRKVDSDLLAILIHRKLGETLELKDLYSSRPYLTDEETGEPYSAGLDRRPGTKDDVKLGGWRRLRRPAGKGKG